MGFDAIKEEIMDDLFVKAKSVDLLHYMGSLGYHPVRETNSSAFFLSPFREESKPSFIVNKNKNIWVDFGVSTRPHDATDFVAKMRGCALDEAARILVNDEAIPQYIKPSRKRIEEKNIEVTKVFDRIENETIIEYLEGERKIPIGIAEKYTKQVLFQFASKRSVSYYGIGWENDVGGWGLRGTWFRGATSPAGVTSLPYKPATLGRLSLFEGMMDRLSAEVLTGGLKQPSIVLNSVVFIPVILDQLKPVVVDSYLDNDAAGDKWTNYLKENGINIVDHREEYKGYGDLNEFLQKR